MTTKQIARIVSYRGKDYSSANFIRLLRRVMENCSVYVALTDGHFRRVYDVSMASDGGVVLDILDAIKRYNGERLDNGMDEIAL